MSRNEDHYENDHDDDHYTGELTGAASGGVNRQGDDGLHGSDADDHLYGTHGDDHLYGGAGVDVAYYTGQYAQYALSRTSAGVRLTDHDALRDGDDLLESVERIHFSDLSIALDTTGTAGAAYRMYRAALDREPDHAGLGYWIDLLDRGASLESVARGFIESEEFEGLYGIEQADGDFVTKLYNNVLDRNPEQAGYDYWIGILANGTSRESVLARFSESDENISNSVELIANGIPYQAPIG